MTSESPPRGQRGRQPDPEARAERRRQILDAAHICFLKKGFHAASTAEISAEANISVAGLYQYFSSKEELIEELIRSDAQRRLTLINEVALADDFFSAFDDIIHRMTRDKSFERVAGLRMEMCAEAARSPAIGAILGAVEHQIISSVEGAVETAQKSGQIDPKLRPAYVATAISCFLDGMLAHTCLPEQSRGPYVLASIDALRRAFATP